MAGKFIVISAFFLLCKQYCFAQKHSDSVHHPMELKAYRFTYNKALIPVALIGLGFLSKERGLKQIQAFDQTIHSFSSFFKPVNMARFAPAVLVYGLNFSGVKGLHNFRDRSIIYLTSQAISTTLTYTLKHSFKEMRPDSSDILSFPSGHSAIAFSAAHFFYREYREKNIWLSIAAYPIAIFSAANRVANNKHWFGDVAAGAGIGILSTETAYWLFPKIKKLLKKNKPGTNLMVLPYYFGEQPGLTALLQF